MKNNALITDLRSNPFESLNNMFKFQSPFFVELFSIQLDIALNDIENSFVQF